MKVCRTTVINILREQRIDPRTDPTRGGWAKFMRAHAESLWQCDFFSKHVSTPEGVLRQCFVLAFVHVATRRVWVSPGTFRPDPAWMVAQARSFAGHAKDVGLAPGVVLRDNDNLFYPPFDRELAAAGAEVKRLAIRAPNTNAYVEHYQTERPHQGKGNRPLTHDGREPPGEGEVLCRERLGGVLRHYYRKTAA